MTKTALRLVLPLALSLLPALSAQAACLNPAEAMSCQISKGRILEVCAGSEQFTYAFGAGDPPEMELSVDFADAEVTPWPGLGHAIWSSIVFRRDAHGYDVFISQDRAGTSDAEGGVIVYKNDKEIARIECLPGTVEGTPEVFGDVMAARGFCWNGNAGLWQVEGSC